MQRVDGHHDGHHASSPDAAILSAADLFKAYGPRPALKGLSFALRPGRVLGFLGPNGAGKTTAIRILTTIMEPDAGSFVVAGVSSRAYPLEIRRRIGVLPENLGYPKHVTGVEYLTYFGQLYGRSAAQARSYAATLLEEVGLHKRAKSLVGTYSRGMKQRLGIARALVNDPAVVFLDEPTSGLDPRGQQQVLSLVRQIAQTRSAGVVLCSHLLWEVEQFCDEVIILSAGEVVAKGTVAEVTGQTRRDVLRVHVAPEAVAGARLALAALPAVADVRADGGPPGWLTVRLAAAPEGAGAPDGADGAGAAARQAASQIVDGLVRAGVPVLGFEAGGGRLHDVFLRVTEEARP